MSSATTSDPRRLRVLLSGLAAGVVVSIWASSAVAISKRALFTPTGVGANTNLGHSVGTAGDINGDGYADVIVGSYLSDLAFTDAGKAEVYFGGPEPDGSIDWFVAGQAAGDGLGRAVGAAGDVNGDGFDDVIVGAYLNNAGGSDAGRAYLYYGGPSLDTVADLILTGTAANDFFGYAVSTAGDVNGDGYDDLLVGAYGNDAGGADAGRAYVFYGGTSPDATADLTFTGAAAGDIFGYAAGTAGDVNDDGFDDVIIGAYLNDAGGANTGRAYVYYGGSSADDVADLLLTGASAGDQFAQSVRTAGDVNGDGSADMIVGATLNDVGAANAGRAYVYYGGPSIDATADVLFTGAVAGDFLGEIVDTAGDVNGDGYADVIVGARFNDAGGADAGRALIYFGGPSIDSTADLTMNGQAAGDQFGVAVGTAGDVDGDGLDDVIVGADNNDAGGSNAGIAYVISFYPYRVLSPNGGEQWVAGRQATVRWRGHDVADLAISLDGGTTWDVLASGVGGLDENRLTVAVPSIATEFAKIRLNYKGQSVSRSTSDVSDGAFAVVLPERVPQATSRLDSTPTGAAANEGMGGAVGTAGDFNGDGHDDVIVGAPSPFLFDTGRAYVVYGGPMSDDVPDLTLVGAAVADAFGSAVGTAGDVNGDGFDDVIVGAYLNDAAGADAGRAYVYYGGASPDATADIVFTAGGNGDHVGISVGTAGDVNGDAFADFIVGASGAASLAGRAYVCYGGPSADGIIDIFLGSFEPLASFGSAVGTAGDVDADGYDDVIVGAPTAAGAGRAHLYHGGPAGLATGAVLTGEEDEDLFGGSVGTAGDVNGDGYADLIVGAPQNDTGGSNAGRAYVYSGGPSVDATAAVTFTGAATGDRFGGSVGTAGDVNGDGYADLIVGAALNDAAGFDAGRAYVYYGGRGGDATADLTLTGLAAEDNFGCAVGSAGEVTGGGFADLIVGAVGQDSGGSMAGRAYVYDCDRYFVLSPSGGEIWNVGASKSVSWSGAEPVDVWLSTDGGRDYSLIRRGVGGSPTNSVQLRVPHTPTRFARVKVTPSDPAIGGAAESDSLFTIQSTVALLSLAADRMPSGGAEVRWSSDPGVGSDGLAGYKLYRDGTRIGPELILEARFVDSGAAPGSTYRLAAVNGLQEEVELGEIMFATSLVGLRLWPAPLGSRDALQVEFPAPLAARGFLATDLDVGIFDLGGRRVATLVDGPVAAVGGVVSLRWEARDRALPATAGVYFVRVSAPSAGYRAEGKLLVIR